MPGSSAPSSSCELFRPLLTLCSVIHDLPVPLHLLEVISGTELCHLQWNFPEMNNFFHHVDHVRKASDKMLEKEGC